MPIKFITGNKNKLEEVQAILPGVEQLDIDLLEIQAVDPHEIIKEKLLEALKYSKEELMVEDTSLCLDCLGGLPGPFIKWFLPTVGLEKLAQIAEKLGDTKAQARTVIGYAKSPGEIYFFEGVVQGTIIAPRGEARFGWDPIFLPDGHSKNYAEMSPDEKNEISQRRMALNKLKEFLAEQK